MRVISRLWPGVGRDLVLNTLVASPVFPRPLRPHALRLYGLNVGRARISPGVWFGSRRVRIDDGTFISYGCMFNTSAPITIGRNCDIAMRVTFVTSSHEIGTATRRAGKEATAPINVGDGVWIGASVTILPGVTIGPGTIIAAGAVVVSDCDANSLYGGVPARKIKSLQAGTES